MVDAENWDWDSGEKQIPFREWSEKYRWVEEPHVSPDGEKIAAIVNIDEGQFDVCVNGETWGGEFDKAWHLRFTPSGRLAAIISEMGEWTVAVDGTAWEKMFGYVWNPIFDNSGAHIAVAFQQDMQYGMALNGVPWEETYNNMTYFALSPDGNRTAGAVQVKSADSGQVHKFQEGTFTAAIEGKAWDDAFVNVWHLAISPDGQNLAAEVRVNLYEYTIAVNGKTWDKTYSSVWEPIFHPQKQSVIAPVRIEGKWTLAENAQPLWEQRFVQLWQQKFGPRGKNWRLSSRRSTASGQWL